MHLQRCVHYLSLTCLCGMLSFISYAQSPTTQTATQAEGPIQTESAFYDLFAGTVHNQQQKLHLRRCSLGSDIYRLNFQNPEDEKQLRNLLQQNTKFWVNVVAQVSEQDGQYSLHVREIAELHTQQSCHLNEVLDELFSE